MAGLRGSLGLGLLLLVTGVLSQNDPPQFTSDMNNFEISEQTAVGNRVFQLEGFDPDDDPVTFGVVSDYFEVVDENNGRVNLKLRLDYETQTEIPLVVWISDNINPRVERSISIRVKDENDEFPHFTEDTYQISIKEDASVGATVYSGITITDADQTGNQLLTVKCLELDNPEVCDTFSLFAEEQTEQLWRGHLLLRRSLTFEDRPSGIWQVPLQASDGDHTEINTVEVTVTDVQSLPPVFLNELTTVISDNIAPFEQILQLVAEDGDTENKREIRYQLLSNPGELFLLDSESGWISTRKTINREDPELAEGFVLINVRATEMYNATHLATDSRSFTDRVIRISIEDSNDNGPVFERSSYDVSIPEDVANQTPLPALSIKVTDADQGTNADFELYLGDYGNIFEVVPTQGSGTVSASVYVKNAANIDYDEGQTLYTVPVIARETRTTERRSSQTLVRVSIIDVNDNPPEFSQTSYTADVSETASLGTTVDTITATDRDSGRNGVDFLRYKLTGNGADFFKVDSRTGVITVDYCFSPGERFCLDYERQKEYRLTYICGDNSGEGFIVTVPLTITILDENDNPPIFTLPDYVSYIREDEIMPDPRLVVQAKDADSSKNGNNRITYSIVGGNTGNLWEIGRTNGLISATQPVDYESTPGNQGYYILTVQATNGQYQTTAGVRIIVIDTNDHSPQFLEDQYEQSINEDTPPGTTVETVRAIDNDASTSPNGQVEYRIESGAQDKFLIGRQSGVITVAPGATFDRETQASYQFTVQAHDQGQPQKFARATVTINILDSNNKSPYFQPSTLRTQVYEDRTAGTPVIRMEATDPDLGATLRYELADPRQGWTAGDQEITTPALYRNLFRIDPNTGQVSVNQRLNRTLVGKVSLTVRATDVSAPELQTGLATLIITILKVNYVGPEFRPPWTPQNPYIDISIEEELPPNSPVYTLIATDDTDLVTYRIIDNPNNHFNINPDTGVITVATPVDYEQEQRVDVVVVAIDNGQPDQLTSTATIRIEIENVNDENPTFDSGLIEVSIPENSPDDYRVTDVTASDLDLGDYGNIRYTLDDPGQRFYIDDRTGVIRVRPGVVLDRETTPEITVTVTAYDSPLDESVRRYASIPVYITLLDENDNNPIFGQTEYTVVISEETPSGVSVIQIQASDIDAEANANLTYYKISGDPDGFFTIDESTGLIRTGQPLSGYPGTYQLTVGATDGGNTGQAIVRVIVLENNNGAPIWEIPSVNNFTEDVLEDQYKGMEIIQVLARDPEGQPVTYHFRHNKEVVQDTPEFHINPYTGVITAWVKFDREKQDTYILQLVARDNGNPVIESNRFLLIRITDTDDNAPSFPTNEQCCTTPYQQSVREEAPIGTTVGQVQAQDADVGNNAEISYHIIDGDPEEHFKINASTGEITTNRELDHEKQSLYTLRVQARNPLTNLIPAPDPDCRCKDPTTVTVYINIIDKNDYSPEFLRQVFNACVPIDANIGRHVLTVQSTDPDTGSSEGVTYALIYPIQFQPRTQGDGVVANNTFLIGAQNGSVHTDALMSKYEDKYFTTRVQATDAGGLASDLADIRIWVTEPTKDVKVTMRQPPDVVNRDIEDIIRLISKLTNWGVVCISDIRYHVTDDGGVITDWTDIFLQVVDGGTFKVIPPDVLIRLIGGNPDITEALLIENIEESYGFWDGFLIDPVVAAIIIVFILLLIALLLVCCFCFCLEAIFGDIYSGTYKQPVVLTGTINPLWQEKGKYYEDQELSMSMLSLETAGLTAMAFDSPDGMAKMPIAGGATTTRTETTTEYQSNYESRARKQQMLANGTADVRAVSTNDIRIETTLEKPKGRSASEGDYLDYRAGGASSLHTGSMLGSGYGGYGGSDFGSRSIGTMTADRGDRVHVETTQRGAYEASFSGPSYPQHRGPRKIGATLTRSADNLDRIGLSPAPAYPDTSRNHRIATVSDSSSYGYATMPHSRVLSPGPAPATYRSYPVEQQQVGYIEPLPIDDGTYQGEIHLGTFRPPVSPVYQQQVQTQYQEQREYSERYNTDGQLYTSIR